MHKLNYGLTRKSKKNQSSRRGPSRKKKPTSIFRSLATRKRSSLKKKVWAISLALFSQLRITLRVKKSLIPRSRSKTWQQSCIVTTGVAFNLSTSGCSNQIPTILWKTANQPKFTCSLTTHMFQNLQLTCHLSKKFASLRDMPCDQKLRRMAILTATRADSRTSTKTRKSWRGRSAYLILNLRKGQPGEIFTARLSRWAGHSMIRRKSRLWRDLTRVMWSSTSQLIGSQAKESESKLYLRIATITRRLSMPKRAQPKLG